MTGLVDQLEGWLGKVSFVVFKRSPFTLLYFTLLYFTLRRPPTCAGNSALLSVTDLRVVFIHGDICLARKGKIVRTGNSSTDSVQIELLEYSPLIAWDLSVCYPVQVSLLTPPDL